MNNNHHSSLLCPICRQEKPTDRMMPGDLIPDSVVAAIQQQNPGWTRHDAICTTCLNQAKMQHAKTLLQAEKGHLSDLDRQVLHSIGTESLLSENPDLTFDQSRTWGARLADQVTVTVGSWYFPTAILMFLAFWISFNVLLQPYEPYPVIILAVISAVLGSLAALQGPIILMSQRHQARLDRLRAENDYRLNLKAELEIRYLSEEMTHFLKRINPDKQHLNQ
ncbi:MAG: DUF1003 domain-containing protein [Anaerolineae bacterium]|nr:DUF1003 domain-containing protein [Anaerolineae bacterium]MCB9109134.1 DUF1003 domain-containing protein [Anaerolineales bacterium]